MSKYDWQIVAEICRFKYDTKRDKWARITADCVFSSRPGDVATVSLMFKRFSTLDYDIYVYHNENNYKIIIFVIEYSRIELCLEIRVCISR